MKPCLRSFGGRGPPALRIHAGVSRPRASTGGSLPPPGPPLAIFPVRGKKASTKVPPGRYVFGLLLALLHNYSYQEIIL